MQCLPLIIDTFLASPAQNSKTDLGVKRLTTPLAPNLHATRGHLLIPLALSAHATVPDSTTHLPTILHFYPA